MRGDTWTTPELDVLSRAHAAGVAFGDVAAATRDQLPGRSDSAIEQRYRKLYGRRAPRSRPKRTIRCDSSNRADRALAQAEGRAALDYERPISRADCLSGGSNGLRPCPFVSCKHHLYLDVNERNGSIRINFADREVWDLPETCALDIADRDGTLEGNELVAAEHRLDTIAAAMGITRERARQIVEGALAKVRAMEGVSALGDFLDDVPSQPQQLPRRHLPVVRASSPGLADAAPEWPGKAGAA